MVFIRTLIVILFCLPLIGCLLNNEVVGVSTSTNSGEPDLSPSFNPSFKIGSGAANTNKIVNPLVFTDDEATDFAIASDYMTCMASSSWLQISGDEEVVLPSQNNVNSVFVKFKRGDQISDCLGENVTHDDQAPSSPTSLVLAEIVSRLTTQTPTVTWAGAGIDNGPSGFKEYQVQLVASITGATVLDWTSKTSGNFIDDLNPPLDLNLDYQVRLRAVDQAGNSSQVLESTYFSAKSLGNDVSVPNLTGLISDFVVVDLNGATGKDIVVLASQNHLLGWYVNDGAENFTYDVLYSGLLSTEIKVVDFDGDADLDILGIGGSGQIGKVSLLRNDGSQKFELIDLHIGLSNHLTQFEALDIDGDGDIDFAGLDNIEFVWIENKGNHKFERHLISDIANSPNFVELAFADFDSDGDLDAVHNPRIGSDHQIVYSRNDGILGFVQIIVSTIEDDAKGVKIVDMNKDDNLDIVTYDSGDNKYTWFENDGGESFTRHQVSNTLAPYNNSWSVIDINVDGELDFIHEYGNNTNNFQGAYNNGSEVFSTSLITIDIRNGYGKKLILYDDLDEDGATDIIYSGSQFGDKNRVLWLKNNGSGSFNNLDITPQQPENVQAIRTGDFNGDTHLDLIGVYEVVPGVGSSGASQFFLMENDGAQNFTYSNLVLSTQDSVSGFELVDLDNDTDLDIVPTGYGGACQFFWFRNDGGGGFTQNIIAGTACNTQQIVDVDSDGLKDLVSINVFDDEVLWTRNTGSGNFAASAVLYAGSDLDFFWVGNLDGDADTELLVVDSGNLEWWDNNGSEVYSFAANIVSSLAGFSYEIYANDFNNDGSTDIFLVSILFDSQIYMNDGSQNFTPGATFPWTYLRNYYFFDYDGDLDIDILIAKNTGGTTLYVNNGDGTYTGNNLFGSNSGFGLGDVNKDSVLDIVTSHSKKLGSVFWFEVNWP